MRFKILMLLICISCSLSSSRKETGPSVCSEVSIKGYLIRKVKRDEIESIQRNDKLKAQGKSYSQAIDYYEEIFFIPVDSINVSRNLSDVLNKNINFYNKQVFFLPSDETKLYLNKFCGSKLKVDKAKNFFTEKYFSILQDQENKYLYSFQYLEGMALHSKIENNHSNKIYMGLNYRIDSSLLSFDSYFIYTINEDRFQLPLDNSIKEWIN